MASINGLNIKKIKKELDHEGMEIISCNIYLGTKQIGYYEDSYWGGLPTIELLPQYSKVKLESLLAKIHPQQMGMDYDLMAMIFDLMELKENEKVFKKAIKNDGISGALIVTDGYHEVHYYIPTEIVNLGKDKVMEYYAPHIVEAKERNKFFKDSPGHEHKTLLFTNIKDFDKGIKIKEKEFLK